MANMNEMASTYLQIQEWIALERKVKDLQGELEAALTEASRATAAAATADARADKAISDLLAAGGAGAQGAGETNRLLAAAAELRTGLERQLAAEKSARQAAEARAATLAQARPGKKGSNLATDNTPSSTPVPAPRAPLEIVYTPQYDAAGKLSKIIAREKT